MANGSISTNAATVEAGFMKAARHTWWGEVTRMKERIRFAIEIETCGSYYVSPTRIRVATLDEGASFEMAEKLARVIMASPEKPEYWGMAIVVSHTEFFDVRIMDKRADVGVIK